MARLRPRFLLEAGALAVLVVATSCAEGDKIPTLPPVTAANIAIVSGSGQTGVITLSLAQPLVVRVTDAGNAGVAGYQVLWTVSTGGGSVPVATTTGSDGTSPAQWVLGTQTGAVTVTAGNTALTGATKSVTFNATAIGASVVLESGSGQSGFAGAELGSDFVVRVTDANGSPVIGKTVIWETTAGGVLRPVSSVSTGTGLASTRYTLGATAGIQTVQATASAFTNSPIVFQAQAQERPLGAVVSVRDNFFTPTPATVAAGSRVLWTWEGFNAHSVNFVDDPDTNSDSEIQQSGVHEVVFLNTGVYGYFCSVHGTAMSGSIIVN